MIKFDSAIMYEDDKAIIIEPTTVFSFTDILRNGLLRSTHEYTITYLRYSKTWIGEVIDADGWRDLSKKEVNDIVEKRKLKGMIQ